MTRLAARRGGTMPDTLLMKKTHLLAALLLSGLLLAAAVFFSSHIDDFELNGIKSEELTFQHNGQRLSGTLLQAENKTPDAVILLIHGDGPMDRYANHGYYPLFNLLLSENLAIFSWDKAGIGKSQGNWLHQSMSDRADEAIAAREMIAGHYQGQKIPVGYFGYSQAGWVIPIAASRQASDFSVIIGGAANWRDQGQYYQALRYRSQGKSPEEIQALLARERQENDALFGPAAKGQVAQRSDMSPDRLIFVQKNYQSDSRPFLSRMQGPVLIALGEDDLNVDAKTDSCRFQHSLHAKPDASVALIPGGTHNLMKASSFNYQLESDWPWYKQAYFLYQGRESYLPGVYRQIGNWIKHPDQGLARYAPRCPSGS